jgi:hypothetical protein
MTPNQLTTSSQLGEAGWAMTRWIAPSSQLVGEALTRWLGPSS